MCHIYITGELGDFSSILKLRRLTEIDAVTFGVLQVLLILHLFQNKKKISSAAYVFHPNSLFFVAEQSELILCDMVIYAKQQCLTLINHHHLKMPRWALQ